MTPESHEHLHLTWRTFERVPSLEPRWARLLEHHLTPLCHNLGCPLLALGVAPERVHALVRLAPTVSVSMLGFRLKSASASWVARRLGEGFRWEPGYSTAWVASCALEPTLTWMRSGSCDAEGSERDVSRTIPEPASARHEPRDPPLLPRR